MIRCAATIASSSLIVPSTGRAGSPDAGSISTWLVLRGHQANDLHPVHPLRFSQYPSRAQIRADPQSKALNSSSLKRAGQKGRQKPVAEKEGEIKRHEKVAGTAGNCQIFRAKRNQDDNQDLKTCRWDPMRSSNRMEQVQIARLARTRLTTTPPRRAGIDAVPIPGAQLETRDSRQPTPRACDSAPQADVQRDHPRTRG